ncbi:hypothetical protein ABPG74_021845 [Tetrahymena malaccensis]
MNQEEGLMIEYLSKVAELILQMRYDPQILASSSAALSSQANSSNSNPAGRSSNQKFGFVLPKQQYKMCNIITEKWNSSCTAMTVEFFLQKKSDGTNYCIEQWQFCYEKEFALPSNAQNGSNSSSNNTNSKANSAPSAASKKNRKQSTDMKLSILSRSIVSLLINTPLWQFYIQSENRTIKNAYILDYKISFAKNKPLSNASSIQFSELQLTSGSLMFNCFYFKDLEKILLSSVNSTGAQNLYNCYPQCSNNCTNNCISGNCRGGNTNNNNSGISNNQNSVSTAHSSPNAINNINPNQYVPNFKKKHERERFLSDNLDLKDLLPQSNQNTCNISASTRINTQLNKENIPRSKHGLIQNQNNMTFRFSFSDNEPLSDEDKKIINHHLRQSSVVSVYSRKDDITIVSTPEEIALKMNDEQANDLGGLEIEMVLEEDKVNARPFPISTQNIGYDGKSAKKQEENPNQSQSQTKTKESNIKDKKYGDMDDKYNVNQIISSKHQQETPTAQIIIDDDFDFQFIEEESDKQLDLAIKKLSDLINQHKISIREQTAFQSAFELYQSLTKYVENY